MKKNQQSIHFNPEFTKALGLEQTEEGGSGPLGIERIELIENEGETTEPVSHAELLFVKEPFNFYYSSWLQARPNNKSKNGWGGKELLERINLFLDSKGFPGFLYNQIPGQVGTIFYKHLGWNEVLGNERWFSYHLPPYTDPVLIDEAINKIKNLDPYFKEKSK